MKKKSFMGIMLLVAAMIFSASGTCFAVDTAVLETTDANVASVYFGPSYCNAAGGQSAYLVSGTIGQDWILGGASVFAVSNTRTTATNAEMLGQAVYYLPSGCTPIGGPQLVSGTTDTFVVYATTAKTTLVDTVHSGATLYCINGGSGAAYWTLGIPFTGFQAQTPATDPLLSSVLIDAFVDGAAWGSAESPFCLAPVTIGETLDANSAVSIFGVSGTTSIGVTGLTNGGASVWQVNSATGVMSSTTQFNAESGVSFVHAAPVISGNSLFVIGAANGGISIFQFNQQDLTITNGNLHGASLAYNNVVPPQTIGTGNMTFNYTPTPCVSGDSIFVVDWTGGLTQFYTQDLSANWMFQFNTSNVVAGVTASPVTDGNRIVLCSGSGVSCYDLDQLSGASEAWAYDFGNPARYQIWQTPVISNNYVWVFVRDLTSSDCKIHRFALNSNTEAGERELVKTIADSYADPIVVNDYLWTVTYNPTVERISQTGFAYANPYWAQFKFDAAKTGYNTKVDEEEPAVVPGSSGGCFISTIQ